MSFSPFYLFITAILMLAVLVPDAFAQSESNHFGVGQPVYVISTYSPDHVDQYEDHLVELESGDEGKKISQPLTGQFIGIYDEDDAGLFTDELVTNKPRRNGGLSLSFDADNSICNGANGQAVVEVTGGNPPYNFIWSNGFTDDTIQNVSAGTYTVTVIDAAGGTVSGSVDINNDNFNINISFNSSNAGCGSSNGSLQAFATMGSAPYNYEWNNGITTSGLNNIPAGAYQLTVTDVNGCTASNIGAVSNTGAPALSFNTQAASCFNTADGSASVTPVGGNPPFNYAWSSGSTSAMISNVSGGAYPVTVTDGSGCQAVSVAQVGLPAELIADVFPVQAACGGMGGKARIEGIGGTAPYTYLWATGDTVEQIGGLVAGLYMASVIDANGCTDWGITNVNTAAPPISVINGISSSCSGIEDGEANLTILAGQPPFNYQWSNGESVEDLISITAGTYSVTLTDANGCQNTNAVVIEAEKEITLSFDVSQVSSTDANNGSISVEASGGAAPYIYQWSNGSTGESISNLALGSYTVTATDANGCFIIDSIDVFILGIDETPSIQVLDVYPNPTHDQIQIDLTLDRYADIDMSVKNTIGQMVYDGGSNFTNAFSLKLDVQSFPPGFYLIEMTLDRKTTITRKFIRLQ